MGQYPLVTMAGFPLPPALAVSCSLPECERLREEGASTPRGTGRYLEIFGAWDLWDRTLGDLGFWLGGRIFYS